jgi:hypothetical protein
MHGLRREIGLTAARARPHGDVLDHQQVLAFAEAPCDMFELNRPGTAMGTVLLN